LINYVPTLVVIGIMELIQVLGIQIGIILA
jgi:hypothetical protein